MNKFLKLISVALVIWTVGYLLCPRNNDRASEKETKLLNLLEHYKRKVHNLNEKLFKMQMLITNLKEKQQRLFDVVYELNKTNDFRNLNRAFNFGPSLAYEENRRKIYSDVKDLTYFLNSQLKQFGNNESVEFLRKNLKHRLNFLLVLVSNLTENDGFNEWRQKQMNKLSKTVRDEFEALQNPLDCANSSKLSCNLNKPCGFGCQLHHIVYCFITAYYTKRTMLLQSNEWSYNPNGYESYFKPISKNCFWTNTDDNKTVPIEKIKEEANINKKYLPLSVTGKYVDSLKILHGDPFMWWAGQVLSYLMRFNAKFEKTIEQQRKYINFTSPCVGVHVRRTDKVGTEASFHHLAEYMTYVEEFYDVYEMEHKNNPSDFRRNVYLASDDPGVFDEAREKYGAKYNFIFDRENSQTAQLNRRYTPDSAERVLFDIFFLSQCDFLVCTFSSSICRVPYVLMQTRFVDAAWRFQSLDDVYYFAEQNAHNLLAIFDHEPDLNRGEIELKKGDLVGIAGNHWDGYSKGHNRRTNKIGLFPSYKAINIVESF